MKNILFIEDEETDYEKVEMFLLEHFLNKIKITLIPPKILDAIRKKEDITKFITNNNFDLILLDVGLNDLGGTESDQIGNDLYDGFAEELKQKTLFVTKTSEDNLTKKKKLKYFYKDRLDDKIITAIEEILGIVRTTDFKGSSNGSANKKIEWVKYIPEFMAFLLMIAVLVYACVFLFLSGKHMLHEYELEAKVSTDEVVHFVESFFLIALLVFMSFAIYIFVKKIVVAFAANRNPPKKTTEEIIKIINTVKNLFVGSIISYVSLSLVSFILKPKQPDFNEYGLTAIIVVIGLLIWFWKVLSKH